jgi:hypothetical protein
MQQKKFLFFLLLFLLVVGSTKCCKWSNYRFRRNSSCRQSHTEKTVSSDVSEIIRSENYQQEISKCLVYHCHFELLQEPTLSLSLQKAYAEQIAKDQNGNN